MEQFHCTTKIIWGAAGQVLKQLSIRRLLLVSDPYFAENGTAGRLAEQVGGEMAEIFSQVTPDPSVELAARGTAVVNACKPDTIVALGGGSAMDCAKAMAYFYDAPVRLVMIPTTSGSGSEVTDFAVLTHGQTKHPLVDRKLQPDVAILDSALLDKLPRSLIADAGFDILSHALEALVATEAGAVTDALAKAAFCEAFQLLPASYQGDLRVRGQIHSAATMAGMAFTQAGLGLCHAMAHCLGGAFHVAHGRLNAVLLPAVVGFNQQAAEKKYAAVGRMAGLGGATDTLAVRSLRNGLLRLRRELGLPQTLQQAGIDPGALRCAKKTLVQAILEDPCCKTNPAPVDSAGVSKILDEVMGHG